jgi:hypothetical protein
VCFATELIAADQRQQYAPGYSILRIGNETAGVRSVEGGTPRGVVASDGPGGKKHIASVSIDPIVTKFAVGDFSNFLAAALGDPVGTFRADGSLQVADATMHVIRQSDFHNAQLVELAVPEVNPSAKAAPELGLSLLPESVNVSTPAGTAAAPAVHGKQKHWTGEFKLIIPGMNTSGVKRIEAFTIRRKSANTSPTAGDAREMSLASGELEIPDIVFYVNEKDTAPFEQWRNDFVIKGNNSDAAEKTMSIELDSPDLKTALASFDCSGVGIVSASPVTSAEGVSETRVEVYVEHMTIGGGGGGGKMATDPTKTPPPPPPAAAPAAATSGDTTATPAPPAPAAVPKTRKRPVAAQPR